MANAIVDFVLNGPDYFIANLVDGSVRIGLKDVCMFDFPRTHIEYDRVRSLVDHTDVEATFDEFYVRYIPIRTDGYAHLNA